MEKFSKVIVKRLLERAIEKANVAKNREIESLKEELETIKLEKELNKEFKTSSPEEPTTDEIDKILGGLNE